jgi:hypothetical protein
VTGQRFAYSVWRRPGAAAAGIGKQAVPALLLAPAVYLLVDELTAPEPRANTALLAGALLVTWLALWGLVVLGGRRRRRGDGGSLITAPYPHRRFPIVALTVGPMATEWRPDRSGPAASPSAERAALRELLVAAGEHRRVIMVHTPAGHDAAERLAEQEGVTDVTESVVVDHAADTRAVSELVVVAVRRAAHVLSLDVDTSPDRVAVVDVSSGPVPLSLAGFLAADVLGCPAHVRATPELSGHAGQRVDDIERTRRTVITQGSAV